MKIGKSWFIVCQCRERSAENTLAANTLRYQVSRKRTLRSSCDSRCSLCRRKNRYFESLLADYQKIWQMKNDWAFCVFLFRFNYLLSIPKGKNMSHPAFSAWDEDGVVLSGKLCRCRNHFLTSFCFAVTFIPAFYFRRFRHQRVLLFHVMRAPRLHSLNFSDGTLHYVTFYYRSPTSIHDRSRSSVVQALQHRKITIYCCSK